MIHLLPLFALAVFTPTAETSLFELARELVSSIRNGQWFVAAALAVMLLVRLFRATFVQNRLPEKSRWERWPILARQALVALVAAAAAFATALTGGMTVAAALWAALPVFLGAVFAHKATQAAGSALTVEGAEPSTLRKALHPVLPIDREKASIRTKLEPVPRGL